jgi:hypothetical protein
VAGQLGKTRGWLDEWGPRARDMSVEEFMAQVEALVRSEIGDEAGDRFLQAAPLDHSYMGLARYWRKRSEREAAA